MTKVMKTDHMNAPVMSIARSDFAVLPQQLTIQQTLDVIREQGLGEKIVYFYVEDENNALIGVVPTRRLLTAPLDQRIADVMIKRVISIPQHATVLEACEAFVLYKLLAFPVVDKQRRITGVVDVSMFTEEVFDVVDQEHMDEIFEIIGFRVSQVREASPFHAFRFRFPWLLATIVSGTICAMLAGIYEVTLAQSLMLAFFLTLVLGLGESVSIQSMTLTIQALRYSRPTFRWYMRTFLREANAALLLGAACGLLVIVIAALWSGFNWVSITIGVSILFLLCAASLLGLSIPTLLHALKLDLRIAAGPVTLAVTDISTLLIYFSLAAWLI